VALPKSKKGNPPVLDALLFVDTNIYLDFYRVRGRDSGLSVLTQLGKHLDRLIVNSQVEMEFLKNRQSAILEALRLAKKPDWASTSVPSFLLDSKPNKAFETAKRQVDAQVQRMQTRIERVLTSPSKHDPVYEAVRPLFRNGSEFCLSRDNDARASIRRLALKRFGLGYPPRKNSDTSIGDAINWEWIIKCAKDSGKHIVLVSRDSDYGASFRGTPALNDWLRQEFAERVSKKRQIVLTDRLTAAFQRVAIPVTTKEVEQETALLEQSGHTPERQALIARIQALLTSEEFSVVELFSGLLNNTPRNADQIAALLGRPRAAVVETLLGAVKKLQQNAGLDAEATS
jgi:hypothetical protein